MSPVFKIIIASENTLERIGMKTAVCTAQDIEIAQELSSLLHLPQDPALAAILTSIPDISVPFEIPGNLQPSVPIIVYGRQFPPAFICQLKKKNLPVE